MRFSDAPSTRASFLNQLKDPSDQRAWAAFVELYKPVIDRWCCQWLQEADADDVCSRVLLKVWNKMREFHYDPSRRFRGWLRQLARNEVLDYLRSLSRRPDARGSGNADVQKALEQVEASPDKPDPDQDLKELEAMQERLYQAMQRVQERAEAHTWQAWLLTVRQGQSTQEVAELLGISVASVYKARQRIKDMIRAEFMEATDHSDSGGSEQRK
jgi:RNA polymerase sigma-70 factor (ECF subfamily)